MDLGLFILYSYGFGDATRHSKFISLRSSISNIKLSNTLSVRLFPQVYFLKLDDREGFYTALSITLSKKNFPFSISTMMNQQLQTTINGKAFDWNLNLIYSFANTYKR